MYNVGGVIKSKADGKPLDKIRVEFWPIGNGPKSIAYTDAEGRYKLGTEDGTMLGALAGKHKVAFSDTSIYNNELAKKVFGRAAEDVDLTIEGKKPRIAMRYTNPTTSPETAEVTGEGQEINFDLEPNTAGAPGGVAAPTLGPPAGAVAKPPE
jgi:hypothetical protein